MHLTNFGDGALLPELRRLWSNVLILNRPGRALETAGFDVESGLADLEAYGQAVLANPDFDRRLREGAAFNAADRATFYGGSGAGYTDYPALPD